MVNRYLPPFNFPMFILIMMADSVVFALPIFLMIFGIDFFRTNGDPYVRFDAGVASILTLCSVVVFKIIMNGRPDNINEHKWVSLLYGILGIIALVMSRMW
jgi:hypothetical protein